MESHSINNNILLSCDEPTYYATDNLCHILGTKLSVNTHSLFTYIRIVCVDNQDIVWLENKFENVVKILKQLKGKNGKTQKLYAASAHCI